MVSKAKELFPEPDTPVNTINSFLGISKETSFKLCSFAPLILICSIIASLLHVKNNFQSEYSGVAAVADQLAREYCLRNNIKPCIVSLSEINSHIAHYKRGRRFFIVKNGSGLNNFIAKFGTDDPNKIIERRMKEANTSKHIDCSDLGELYMYMPESVIQQYLIKIREHPLLH